MANISSQKRYHDELAERAVKMVLELRRDEPGSVERILCELRTERPMKSSPAHYFLNLEF